MQMIRMYIIRGERLVTIAHQNPSGHDGCRKTLATGAD